MDQIFISYSRHDKETAIEIEKLILNNGFVSFRDEKDIKLGDDIDDKVSKALRNCLAVIVVISPSSLNSNWVAYEIGYATALRKRILPYLIHKGLEKNIPDYISRLHFATSFDELDISFSSINQIRSKIKTPYIKDARYSQEYIEWWDEQNKLSTDSIVEFGGLQFNVRRNVFSPDYSLTYSSHLASSVLDNLEGKKVLDIGCGCGCLGIIALKKGAKKVVAVDVDDSAIANTKENLVKHGLSKIRKYKLLKADLFSPESKKEHIGKFHLIVANLPIAFKATAWNHLDIDFTKIYDRFTIELADHLLPGGKAYLTWASFGDEEFIEDIFNKNNLIYKAIIKVAFGITWKLYELRPRNSRRNIFK